MYHLGELDRNDVRNNTWFPCTATASTEQLPNLCWLW